MEMDFPAEVRALFSPEGAGVTNQPFKWAYRSYSSDSGDDQHACEVPSPEKF